VYSDPPDALAGFHGPASKGKGSEMRGFLKERRGKGREGKEWEGRGVGGYF